MLSWALSVSNDLIMAGLSGQPQWQHFSTLPSKQCHFQKNHFHQSVKILNIEIGHVKLFAVLINPNRKHEPGLFCFILAHLNSWWRMGMWTFWIQEKSDCAGLIRMQVSYNQIVSSTIVWHIRPLYVCDVHFFLLTYTVFERNKCLRSRHMICFIYCWTICFKERMMRIRKTRTDAAKSTGTTRNVPVGLSYVAGL